MTMTLKETLAQLKALGNEKVRAHDKKHGAGDNPFGVKRGDIFLGRLLRVSLVPG